MVYVKTMKTSKLLELISWSEKNFSHLPWRRERTLYSTLISEIMLQQTTVGTVRNHFERFLGRFPNLKALAESTEEELVVAWKGLGYYRRARSLKRIAETLVKDYEGDFPEEEEVLMKIPGIGPYTAGALIAIGMNKRALAVDANLERVIARLFHLKGPKGIKLQKEIKVLFQEKKIFSDIKSYRKLNEALMDLGRTFCQARKATCELCPLKESCLSFKHGNPLNFPMISEREKKEISHDLHLLRIMVIQKRKLLVYKKSSSEWLSGQYEPPTFTISTTDKKFNQYPQLHNMDFKSVCSFKTGITKYKIKNDVIVLKEKDFKKLTFPKNLEWRLLDSEESNFSTATLKALREINIYKQEE
jgi:A/G-specific adenine glycosylase